MTLPEGPLVRRIEELASRLEEVEDRLTRLERGGAEREAAAPAVARAAAPAPAEVVPAAAAAAPREELRDGALTVTTRTVPLVGRTVLVLGGAFLLRAITEAELVPQAAGSVVGLAYAVTWLVFADRVALRQRTGDATFHGLATALIAFPLLWESTLEFGIISPPVAALALLGTACAGLAVAWRRNLPSLAWVVLCGALPTAIALGFASRSLPSFLACVLALALAAGLVTERLRTPVLGALVAMLVDVVFLFLGVVMLANPDASVLGALSPWALLSLQAALVLVYWGSSGVHVLVQGKELTWVSVVQAIAVLFVGVGPAAWLALSAGVEGEIVGAVMLLLGGGAYAAAFGFVERRQGRGRTFHVYAASALLLTVAAVPLGLDRVPTAVIFGAGGAAVVAFAAPASRGLLTFYGSVYVLAACVSSGLLVRILDAFLGSAGEVAPWFDVGVIAAMIAAAAAGAFPVPRDRWSDVLTSLARVGSGLVALMLVLGAAALVVTLGAVWLPRTAEGPVDPAALATLRTGVLSVAAVVLMGISYRPKWSVLRTVGFALVAMGGVKLLLEDLRVGHAATLTVSLVLYGGALLLMSRFLTGAKKEEPVLPETPAPGDG